MDLLSGGPLIVGAVPDSLCTNQLQAKSAHFIGSATSGRRLTATKDPQCPRHRIEERVSRKEE